MPRARSSVAHFAKLLDEAATPVYVLDDERRIVYCNPACAAWLGLPVEELTGAKCAFHSSLDGPPASVAAAGICPPPEVFAGQRLRAMVAAPHENRAYEAEFLPIQSDSETVALVLAVVYRQEAPKSATIGEESDEALHEVVRRFRHTQASRYRVDRLIGRSPQIARARQQVQIAIDCAASVLIVGPAGSGKDHVARTIHYRGGEPIGQLLPLACATLGADLLISTLAAAVNAHPLRKGTPGPTGTLLLGDVDELPIDTQAEFVRLLVREGTSLRLIATASQSLQIRVAKGEFPLDLACALDTIEIDLPPLAGRIEDLPSLTQLLLEETNSQGEKQISSLMPETLDMLATHNWPGNLDELASVVIEAHARATGTQITPRDLPQRIHWMQEAAARPKPSEEAIDLEEFLGRAERELIERALARAKGNKTRAAKLLGMTRPRFYRRLVQLKLIE